MVEKGFYIHMMPHLIRIYLRLISPKNMLSLALFSPVTTLIQGSNNGLKYLKSGINHHKAFCMTWLVFDHSLLAGVLSKWFFKVRIIRHTCLGKIPFSYSILQKGDGCFQFKYFNKNSVNSFLLKVKKNEYSRGLLCIRMRNWRKGFVKYTAGKALI